MGAASSEQGPCALQTAAFTGLRNGRELLGDALDAILFETSAHARITASCGLPGTRQLTNGPKVPARPAPVVPTSSPVARTLAEEPTQAATQMTGADDSRLRGER